MKIFLAICLIMAFVGCSYLPSFVKEAEEIEEEIEKVHG